MSKNLKHFFITKLNILRVMLLTQHLHKNFTTKYKLQVVKGRLKKKKVIY